MCVILEGPECSCKPGDHAVPPLPLFRSHTPDTRLDFFHRPPGRQNAGEITVALASHPWAYGPRRRRAEIISVDSVVNPAKSHSRSVHGNLVVMVKLDSIFFTREDLFTREEAALVE